MNCTNSPSLYEESAEHLREEEARRKANRRKLDEQNHGAVMRMEEHQSVSVSSQTARNFEVHGNRKFEKKSQQQYQQEPEQRRTDQQINRGVKKFDQNGQFGQKETLQCGESACGRNRQGGKVVEKNVGGKVKSGGGSSNRNDIVESKLEPSDSDEAQITQETASFYKNRANNIQSESKTNTLNPYPNHRQTYSDLKNPNYYTQYTSTTNSYTTKAINNGQPFVGSSVATVGYESVTTETPRDRFYDNNAPTTYSPATYKSQVTTAAPQNNYQYGSRLSGSAQRNLPFGAKTRGQKTDLPTTTTVIPTNDIQGYNNYNRDSSVKSGNQFSDTASTATSANQNQAASYSTSENQYSDQGSNQQGFDATASFDFGIQNSQAPTGDGFSTTLPPNVQNGYTQQGGYQQFSGSYSTQYFSRGTSSYQPTTTAFPFSTNNDQVQTTTTTPTADNVYTQQSSYNQFGARQRPTSLPSTQYPSFESTAFNRYNDGFSRQYQQTTTTLLPDNQYETTTELPRQENYEQTTPTTTAVPSTQRQNGYYQYEATGTPPAGKEYSQSFGHNLSIQYQDIRTTTFGPPDVTKNEYSNTHVYNAAQGGYLSNFAGESTQFPSTATTKTSDSFFTSELFNVGNTYSPGSRITVPSTVSPRLYVVSSNAPVDTGFIQAQTTTTTTTEPTTTAQAQTTTYSPSSNDLSAVQNTYYSGRSGGRAFLNLLPSISTTEQPIQSTASIKSELFNTGSTYNADSQIVVSSTPSPRLYIVAKETTSPTSTTYEPSTVTERFSSSYAYTVGAETLAPSTRAGNADTVTTPATPFTSAVEDNTSASKVVSTSGSDGIATSTVPTTVERFNDENTFSVGSQIVVSTTTEQPELVTDQSPRGFSASVTETSPVITTELFNTGQTYGPNTTIVVSSSTKSPKLYVVPKGEGHRLRNFLDVSTPKVVLGIVHSDRKGKEYKATSGRFSGFYVTKSNSLVPETTPSLPYGAKISTPFKDNRYSTYSLRNEFLRPKPFSYQSTPSTPTETTTTTESSADSSTTPTFYQISSASPFKYPESKTFAPTQPTPYVSEKFNSVYENVDNMINALMEIAKANEEKSTDGARPGLVIPPSAGPETLHSLARYFANALDNLASARSETTTASGTTTTITPDEGKKAVNDRNIDLILTHSTVDRYKELFNEKQAASTTVNPNQDSENDLDTENSNGPVQTTPRIRQLAQVFTQALSAYLDDPATFRKVLEEVRPTEPPNVETTTIAATTTTSAPSEEDEVLNFSDADVKIKPLPVFPTVSTTLSASPTWGYILALNNTSEIAANSVSGPENLQGADSQSFVSQFNNLPTEKKAEVIPHTTLLPSVVEDVKKFNEAFGKKLEKDKTLPPGHWTDSSDATKLWQKNLFVNPSALNDNLDFGETTTESPATSTTAETFDASSTIAIPTAEVSYELRSLPQLRLNSTQVHGLLIDFMNKTEESDKLQRILKKLNTTEEEFLNKMKQIESNPLTKRLILLLISECGQNATQEFETRAASVLDYTKQAKESLQPSSSNAAVYSARETQKVARANSSLKELVHPSLDDNEQDARALQLLNSLYTIASQWGK